MSIRRIPPWHVLFDKGKDSAEQPEEDHSHDEDLTSLVGPSSRRGFIRKAAAAVGATGIVFGSGLSIPMLADHDENEDEDHEHKDDRDGGADDAASPLPIPGGTILPFSTERYHFFFPPGTNNGIVNIPPSPGVNDPSTITDFMGFVGQVHAKGAGTGTNTDTGATSRFFFDTDTRFMKGKYIGMCDHKEHRGNFAFI